jgi:enoyl-CoA hydratase/carnithine racemase
VGYEQIDYLIEEDGVPTLTRNRPDRLDAFTEQMIQELVDVFDAADGDDDVRVVVLTGAGRDFCAGADLGPGGATSDHPAGPAIGARCRPRPGDTGRRLLPAGPEAVGDHDGWAGGGQSGGVLVEV